MDDRGRQDAGVGATDEAVREYLVILRAQLGDVRAYRTLVEDHGGGLERYLTSLMSTREDAEDVFQDVWLTVVRKLGQLEDPSSFRGWLYRIAHNRAISALRRRGREAKLLTCELPLPDLAIDEGDGSVTALDGVDGRALWAAMHHLSASHREVLTLKYFEGLTYEEIARVVASSVGTVRSRLHYAKRALKDHLLIPPPGRTDEDDPDE